MARQRRRGAPRESGERKQIVSDFEKSVFVDRDRREVSICGRSYPVLEGKTQVGGLDYWVLGNVRSGNIDVSTDDENVLFDTSCTKVGDVECGGRVVFLGGNVEAKSVVAHQAVLAYGKLSVEGPVISYDEDVQVLGDVSALSIAAEDNVKVLMGSLKAETVRSHSGSIMAQKGDIVGNSIIALKGVSVMGGRIVNSPDVPQESCSIWAPEGDVFATNGIKTGRFWAGGKVMTSWGDLEITGDSFCLGGDVRGGVQKPDSARIYSVGGVKYSGGAIPAVPAEKWPYDQEFDFSKNWEASKGPGKMR